MTARTTNVIRRPSGLHAGSVCPPAGCPGRVSGRRVYGERAVTEVQTIGMARSLGFGVRDIRTLVHGGQSPVPITDRWRSLARRKLPELDSLIDRATRMKRLMETGLTCSCVRIEDCILHGCAPPLISVIPV